jgi:hypothetical protein
VVVADMLDGERREAVAGAHVRCPVKQGRGRRGCEGAGSSRVAGTWRRWIEDTGDTEAPETVRKGAGDIGGCAVGMGSVGV